MKKLRIRNLPNGNTANIFEQDSNPDRCHSAPSFLVTSSTVPEATFLSCSNRGHPEDRQRLCYYQLPQVNKNGHRHQELVAWDQQK